MKWILGVVLSASLVASLLAASTIYAPKLRAELDGLTLDAAVGLQADGEAAADPGTTLDAGLIDRLDALGVERVRIREFRPGFWSEWWLFAVGLVGLVGSTVVGRKSGGSESSDVADRAEAAIRELRTLPDLVARLRARPASDPAARAEDLMAEVDRMAAGPLDIFITGRGDVSRELGLARFAEVMDHFAAGERALNRVWSAAADGYLGEAEASLERAENCFGDVHALLADIMADEPTKAAGDELDFR